MRATFRALREIYSRNERPPERTISRIVKKFEETGSVVDQATPVRRRNVRSIDNIAVILKSVRENSNLSITRRSQEVGISKASTWRILRKDLGLHPYKIQLTQELKTVDRSVRRTFADWALEQLETDPNFGAKIIFSDEAHFWLNGFVNKQNYHFWAGSNPREIQQVPLNSEKITVWCGFWARR